MFGWKAEFLFYFISFLASIKKAPQKRFPNSEVYSLARVSWSLNVKLVSRSGLQVHRQIEEAKWNEVTRCLFVRLFVNVRNTRPHAVCVGVNCTRVNESYLACHLHIIYNIRELGKAGRTWLGSVIKWMFSACLLCWHVRRVYVTGRCVVGVSRRDSLLIQPNLTAARALRRPRICYSRCYLMICILVTIFADDSPYQREWSSLYSFLFAAKNGGGRAAAKCIFFFCCTIDVAQTRTELFFFFFKNFLKLHLTAVPSVSRLTAHKHKVFTFFHWPEGVWCHWSQDAASSIYIANTDFCCHV